MRRNPALALQTALLASSVVSACGSPAGPPVAPDAIVRPVPTESGGAARATAVAPDTKIVGCTCFVLGYDFTTTSCVSALSSSGNETVTCRGQVLPTTGETQVVFGQSCLLAQTGEYSTISQLVINPNGGATLRCQSK
jgi:hypothetical protein